MDTLTWGYLFVTLGQIIGFISDVVLLFFGQSLNSSLKSLDCFRLVTLGVAMTKFFRYTRRRNDEIFFAWRNEKFLWKLPVAGDMHLKYDDSQYKIKSI